MNRSARVVWGLAYRGREGADALAEAGRILRRDARLYGTSEAAIARRAAELWRGHGFTVAESHRLGLLDPAAPPEAAERHVSKRRLLRLQAALNPQELMHLTEEKTTFYRLAEAAGLPVPVTHAVLCHSGSGATAAGRPLQGRAAWVDYLEHEAPREFVIKPAWGYHGLGVRLVRREGGRLALRDGERLTAAELCDRLLAERRFRVNLVQERLRNHPDMPGDPDVLSSLRVITLVDERGEAAILAALLRIGVGTTDVSNLRGGRTGNASAEIDPATGTVVRLAGVDDHGKYVELPEPDGRVVPGLGWRVPFWDEAMDLARGAAAAFLPMRALAWDLGITATGAAVIEANKWWDPPTGFGGTPLMLARMRAAAAAGPPALSVERPVPSAA
jgi:hypothetical protein